MVEQLDLSTRMAYCRAAADLKYYTRVHDVTKINILQGDGHGDGTTGDETASSSSSSRATAQSSDCRVMTEWVRFDRIWKSKDQMSDSIELDLPPYSFHTQAVWVSVPVAVRAAVE